MYYIRHYYEPGKMRVIEGHETPEAAFRAMLILSAHEVKNGRTAAFKIEPSVSCTVDEVRPSLPDWAQEVLFGSPRPPLATAPIKLGGCDCGSTKYRPGHMPWEHAGWEP